MIDLRHERDIYIYFTGRLSQRSNSTLSNPLAFIAAWNTSCICRTWLFFTIMVSNIGTNRIPARNAGLFAWAEGR